MSKRPSSLPSKIRIWQQNTHKSKKAHDYLLAQANPSDWDIILIQEPWLDSYGNARGSQYWRVLYPSNFLTTGRDRIRSIILINTNISTDSYISFDIQHSDITAIRLSGEFGHCSIFNIYNDCTNNDTLTTLDSFLTTSAHVARPTLNDHMLWLGDFNRHHPLWEENSNRHLFNNDTFIDPLLDLIREYDMTMALPLGIPTFETVTGNWTRPDNVWRSNNPDNPITICNVSAEIRPPFADHMPIVTILDIPISRSSAPPSRNVRLADFEKINKKLKERLTARCPAVLIENKNDFEPTVNLFIDIINEVLDEEAPLTKPCPYTKRWWTKELTDLKEDKNRLSNQAYKFRAIPNHPTAAKHKVAVNKFAEVLEATRSKHWTDWLEDISTQDVYIANKYVTSEPTDYSSARIPSLKTTVNGIPHVASTNTDKSEALSKTFFPPRPTTSAIPDDYEYPTPLPGINFFTRTRIRDAISKLHPYKAPGPDSIPNAVLMKCADTIIDHLFYIFRAVFDHDVYPARWLHSITLVLRKPGKPAYDVAKAYRPIGLLDTVGKLLSTLVANDLSYLAEKHSLLPATQFGGRPGRCTTDAMHLVTQRVKDAWRQGNVASALFLDIQAAFPNTVIDRLIHNMKARKVPSCYIRLAERMLRERFTRLKFDDFISDPISIDNGTTQGCPLSMLFYAFYNASLIEVAIKNLINQLALGFVDDSCFIAFAKTLDECHRILEDMMERAGGGFDWSFEHNSPYELTKLAGLDFPRSFRDTASSPITLTRTNPDRSQTKQIVQMVNSYKYLGVHFDSKLNWKIHTTKVIASATWWTNQLWRISKTAGGLPPSRVRQLYNTVAVPAFTYAADIWYTGTHKPAEGGNMKGSVGTTRLLRSVQRKAAKFITGALNTTAGDVMDIHANLLPIDLLFHKILFRAASRICTLPDTHPLFKLSRRAAGKYVKRHRSPMHNLFYLTRLHPAHTETITPIRRRPSYRTSFTTIICESKEKALELATTTNDQFPTRIYCDGSGFEGGIGAAAVLYQGPRLVKSLKYYLGPKSKHTVYEAEGVGITLGLHMLANLKSELADTVIIGVDSQATIKSLKNQRSHAGQYILDHIHDSAETLHEKQDSIQHKEQKAAAKRKKRRWKGRKRGVIDLQIQWVPGHMDFAPNERADEEAKKAAQGKSSDKKDLPKFLRRQPLPASISALRQDFNEKLQKRWSRRWKKSPRYRKHHAIDNSSPSKKWLKLVDGLRRNQSSLSAQLRTGHIGLNHHLSRIKRSDTPFCPHCRGITAETVRHFLLDCPEYAHERHILQRKLRREAGNLSYLLSNPTALLPLLRYVHSTKRLKPTLGSLHTSA